MQSTQLILITKSHQKSTQKHKSNLTKTSASAGLQDTNLIIQPYTTAPPRIPTAHSATMPRLLGEPPLGTSESSHLRPTHPGSNATTVTPREHWYGVYADCSVLGGNVHSQHLANATEPSVCGSDTSYVKLLGPFVNKILTSGTLVGGRYPCLQTDITML